jgi:hypothetical protein
VFTYADNTSTNTSNKSLEKVLEGLERDAEGVLQFMASNGQEANPQKTVFMLLGGGHDEDLQVKVGNIRIPKSATSKLLGMVIDEDLKWKTHVQKLINALDKRLFFLRRIAGTISKHSLIKLAVDLWTSKMRYRLQLCQKVKTTEDQTKSKIMSLLQRAQNRMLRTLTWLANRTRIEDVLEMTDSLSVNQTKLGEMWKAATHISYPVKMERVERNANERYTRQSKDMKFKFKGRTKLGRGSFVVDEARLRNNILGNISSAKTIGQAKQAIRTIARHCQFDKNHKEVSHNYNYQNNQP